jgi:EAL domain-containing protein (putative c-di-GMP-specific phosphodiesterase class I)
MAPAILAIQALRDQRLDIPVIVTGCALLFLLVLVRMADLVRENEATVRELRGTEGVLRASLSERDTLAAQLEHLATPGCPQMAGWIADAGPPLLHVNLSAHHLLRSDLAASVAAALGDSRLPPGCLALEITESVLMHDLEVAIVRLHELKALGVHLAIDDFGTGYSSLGYLRRFPIDALKIDKAFVGGVAGGAEEPAVARAIIALAGTLHLDTVAEGVEHPEQATALAELGCHLAQGFHFSRPVPAADLATRLAGQQPVAGLRHPA